MCALRHEGRKDGRLERLGEEEGRLMKSFIVLILFLCLTLFARNSIPQDAPRQFGGIGFSVTKCGKKFLIKEIFENTPASRAGLEIGDEIVRVDRSEIDETDLFEVVKMLRGEIGTPVVLTLVRKGIQVDVLIRRERIEPPPYKKALFNGYIGYVKFYSNDLTIHELEGIFSYLKEQKVKALIIDFRDFGGFRRFDTDLYFIRTYSDDNRIGYTEDRNGDRAELSVVKPIIQPITPTAIIVNSETAGGAEMITIAWRDYGKAYVTGQKTKGNTFTIKDKRGIPTYRYISPKGSDVHGKGIMPDKVVEIRECEIVSDMVVQETIKYLEGALR
jgi:carboxyl-terminal processing protease